MFNKYVIGITGNSGSGKSTVAETLRSQGVDVIDADILARNFMKPGQKCYDEVVKEFGPDILDYNGDDYPTINRKKLAEIVYNDKVKRDRLEGLVWPWVIRESVNLIKLSKEDIVAIDAVLLVESCLHKLCDTVWIVRAGENVRLQRIMERDNITLQQAELRMKNQRDIEATQFEHNETKVIVNDNCKNSLQTSVVNILEGSTNGRV